MNVLNWLENWYFENCDGDWEHSKSVNIVALDNPGWAIDIYLEGTILEDKDFKNIDNERTDTDWVYCSVTDNIFKGRGGAKNLEELLVVFQTWSESYKN